MFTDILFLLWPFLSLWYSIHYHLSLIYAASFDFNLSSEYSILQAFCFHYVCRNFYMFSCDCQHYFIVLTIHLKKTDFTIFVSRTSDSSILFDKILHGLDLQAPPHPLYALEMHASLMEMEYFRKDAVFKKNLRDVLIILWSY